NGHTRSPLGATRSRTKSSGRRARSVEMMTHRRVIGSLRSSGNVVPHPYDRQKTRLYDSDPAALKPKGVGHMLNARRVGEDDGDQVEADGVDVDARGERPGARGAALGHVFERVHGALGRAVLGAVQGLHFDEHGAVA